MMTDFDISQIRAEALRLSLSHVSTQWMIDWPDIDVLAITRDIVRGG